jgi:succinate-semialdehyde dehydrogenase/glutarate-semialdehyde dehydrogenase
MVKIPFSALGFERPALYIGGHWCAASSSQTRPVVNPATEAEIAQIPVATHEDLAQAGHAAQQGLKNWSEIRGWARAKALHRTAELIRGRMEPMAITLTLETGKSLEESREELHASADHFDWMAEESKRISGHTLEPRESNLKSEIFSQPVGVVVGFTPWNLPALLPARRLSAALAAGCSVILKPSEEAPLSCMALFQCLHESGLPPGVVNLVVGEPSLISKYYLSQAYVRRMAFTGSTQVGKNLLRDAAENLKALSLELSGHAPVIIAEDADPNDAALACVKAKFMATGQGCLSPSRFFVHETIERAFTEAFVQATQKLRVGDPTTMEAQVGPLKSARRRDAIEALVADAVREGAQVLCGGQRPEDQKFGFFYLPTVLGHVPREARLLKEEPFGPIAPILPFSHLQDVVKRANELPFGLAGYVFSSSPATCRWVAERLEVGMVGINTFSLTSPEVPHTGRKESELGRTGGQSGTLEFLEQKCIRISQSDSLRLT